MSAKDYYLKKVRQLKNPSVEDLLDVAIDEFNLEELHPGVIQRTLIASAIGAQLDVLGATSKQVRKSFADSENNSDI